MWDRTETLLGPDASLSGTPGAQTAKFLGRNRTYRVWGRVNGAVSAGGGANFLFEQSNSVSGPWVTVPGTAAGMLPLTVQTVPVSGSGGPAIPATISPYSAPPNLPNVVITPTQDYVRVTPTLTGTTPTLAGVNLNVEPIAATVLASGR